MSPILLNPGPVTLSDGVRRAAVAEDLCHREPEFTRIQEAVLNGLVAVYDCDPAEWQSIALGGSGTVAMEAMVASLLPADGALLVLENGVYGERLSSIADIHGIENASVRAEWGAPIDLAAVEATLASGNFSHLAMVHHETTTGRLNPLAPVADLCQRHGVGLLLDAVSSFGAEEIPFEHPALVACAATANKCLHGIPGLCFVIARRAALAAAAEPPRSLYLHLPLWLEKQEAQTTPFTPSVNGFLALRQALVELRAQGGWPARRARYRELAGQVREALAGLGVQPLLEAADSSCALTAYRLPEGSSYEVVHDGLKRWGFVIYAGQGSLVAEMFRISTMGDITRYDMERLLAAMETVFRR